MVTAGLLILVGLAVPAQANLPHFKTFTVTPVSSGGGGGGGLAAQAADTASAELPDLRYVWTELGIGKPDVTYNLETVVTATFGCLNGGSNRPRATNKTTMTAPLQQTVELMADRNGRISGDVVLNTAEVFPPGFECPGGQTVIAISATFAQNSITDVTNGVTATAPDISVTLFP